MAGCLVGAWSVGAAGAELTASEVKRKAMNDAADKRQLRQKTRFVVERSPAFLKVPEQYANDTSFDPAKTAPTVKLQILPDLNPEYFTSTNQYMACWANWAHVARSDDNRFYLAASDHLAKGCSLNVYEYAPRGKAVVKRIDVGELLGWKKDVYTDGKLHGEMGVISNKVLWGATHFGVHPDDSWYAAGYKGSWVFSYDLETGQGRNWGSPLPKNSLSCFTVDTGRGILVGTGEMGGFLHWDCNTKQAKFAGPPPNGWRWWARALLCDEPTGVFWGMDCSEKPYRFMSFNPANNEFKRYDVEVPAGPKATDAGSLRGYTPRPAMDGYYYWATLSGVLFKFKPGDPPVVETVGTTWDAGRDTLQLAVSPKGRYVYYFPKGDPSPVIQLDVKTGRKKTLGWLQEFFHEKYGYVMGECYGFNISTDGSFLVACMNGTFSDKRAYPYGHPSCLVIEIPKSERVE